jgi:PepSY-associated transmembrane protein
VKAWFLRFHRWIALVFALPLLFVLGSAVVLAFEPWVVVAGIDPGSLTPAKIEALLSADDPGGKANSLTYRTYDKTLTIAAARGAAGTVVDVATGNALSGPSALANVFVTARRIHERLLIDASSIVIASTVTMLVLAILGVLLGWPRVANTLSGWHKGMAWGLLPLIVLSPLTGLLLAFGITLAGPPPAPAKGQPPSLSQAVRIVGEHHDLSALVWLRPRGGHMLARLVEDGEYRVYDVTRDGTVAVPRNWPRLWHEGNFAGRWSAAMNIVTAIAMFGLLVTGPLIWLRRRLRSRRRQERAAGVRDEIAVGTAAVTSPTLSEL